MIKYNNKKMTANQLAKEIVFVCGTQNSEVWGEFWTFEDTYKAMTQKEIEDTYERIEHHENRLRKFLGLGE